MKRFMSLLASAIIVTVLAVTVHAEGMMKGKVVSIDPEGKTIVIKTADGEKTAIFQETTEGFKSVKPGMNVEMTCIDVGGKSCAKIIRPMKPIKSLEGEVVSIDPAGKTVVIRTMAGKKVTVETMTEEAEVMKPSGMTGEAEGMMTVEEIPVSEIMPGMHVKMDCFDSGEKFCANRITTVSPAEAGNPVPGAREITGEVVSIDSDGKAVVVKTVTGEKTLYYQKVTSGAPMDELRKGGKIQAYCLDIEGKSCIKDINTDE